MKRWTFPGFVAMGALVAAAASCSGGGGAAPGGDDAGTPPPDGSTPVVGDPQPPSVGQTMGAPQDPSPTTPTDDGGGKLGWTSAPPMGDVQFVPNRDSDALGTNDPSPTCDAGVACFVDPCQGKTVTCDATQHCAVR